MTPAKLTPRETEIVAGVTEGLTNLAIAHRLSISENTVKVHLQGIFSVTGVTSRVQLAMMFAGKDVAPTPTPRLSPRQQEVLKLIALGKAGGEIAQQLNLSQKTVEAHRYNLMRKLDLHNVADVVIYAARNGIVELVPRGGQ
jgi:DNA-binding NarL/FixJ family response regulator